MEETSQISLDLEHRLTPGLKVELGGQVTSLWDGSR